jgi:hypothetical protein
MNLYQIFVKSISLSPNSDTRSSIFLQVSQIATIMQEIYLRWVEVYALFTLIYTH